MRPVLFAFLAATMWGLWWIPIRFLDSQGLTGAVGGVAMNIGALLAALLWMVLKRQPLQMGLKPALGATLVGMSVATYSAALGYGDVVRLILLFYMAPAWSKIVEWAFLGLPWRWTSTVALVAALSGCVLILGGDVSGAGIGLGDILALASGAAWAIGASLIFAGGRSDALSLTVLTCTSAVAIGVGFSWIVGDIYILPSEHSTAALGIGFGVLYVTPILALTLWSAQRLAPATLTFLLTAEILSGVVSGALLLDEPFGALQMAGASLIVFGALSEVLPSLRANRINQIR